MVVQEGGEVRTSRCRRRRPDARRSLEQPQRELWPSNHTSNTVASHGQRRGGGKGGRCSLQVRDCWVLATRVPRCCPLQYSSCPTDRKSFGCRAVRAAASAAVHCRPALPSTPTTPPPMSQPPPAAACVLPRCLSAPSVWLSSASVDAKCPSIRCRRLVAVGDPVTPPPPPPLSPAAGLALTPPPPAASAAAARSCALSGCGTAASPGSCSPWPRVSPGAGGGSPVSMPPYRWVSTPAHHPHSEHTHAYNFMRMKHTHTHTAMGRRSHPLECCCLNCLDPS